MLTPYNFSVITGLRLGSERIKVNDFLTLKEIKSLSGVVPSKLKRKNVPLMWLYENIESCKTMATGTRMFMLLFTGTFLCPDLGSIVSLRYLWSLRDINQINNYDWGGMAYATFLHFMTQLSRHSLSSLRGAPFVWQVWMYEYFGVGPQVREDVDRIYPRFLCCLPKYHLSKPSKCSLEVWCMVIDNITIVDMSLDPWLGCEEYVECEWALELNGRQVLFEHGHGRVVWPAFLQPRYLYFVIMSKEEEEGEENPPSSHASSSSSSFMEAYPHIPKWQYEVMNPVGSYSSMALDRPKHTPNVDVDLVEESMRMIGDLQLVARTQSSQYVINEASWYQDQFYSLQTRGNQGFGKRQNQVGLPSCRCETYDLEDHVFRFKTAELCPTIEEFSAILGYDPSKKSVAVSCDPRQREFLFDALGLNSVFHDGVSQNFLGSPLTLQIWLIERLDMIARPTIGSHHTFIVGLRRATFYKADRLLRQFEYEQGMPSGKGRKPFTPMDTNPTSIRNMLLGLEMVDRMDQSFVKVHFHRMTNEYSNWLVDKIADNEADMVTMRKEFLRDNRERHDDDNYEFKRRDKGDIVPSSDGINEQPKKKRPKTK
ncbi:hypothetical protein SO802_028840 [Lithocarpus litseifolius]|uniref:Aminotransferase-like plant mobile domain-containing protein n=1 Tax=Lithocarpus litseifolius TaxID=425828 RepID=A0AAW2BTD8_9ROSI